jgi:kynureninase
MLVMTTKRSSPSPLAQTAERATARAAELDHIDALRSFRERFVDDDPEVVYLDGNSLGRLPKATAERLAHVVRSEWGRDLVRGWDHWIDDALRVGEQIGTELIGAQSGETAVSDSTTVNLYKLASAALAECAGRRFIVASRDEFPTDRYVLEGLAARYGMEMRWLQTDPVDGTGVDDIRRAADQDVALVVLSLVNYRSSAFADMAGISAAAHEVGALILWDLSHAVGAVPIDVQRDGADLAVGCTYKYLSSGPGAPAFLYVRREHQARLHNPIQGWFGQHDMFAMGPTYDPEPGVRSWLAGTPGILALAAVEEGVRITAEAGMSAIRQKSTALTEFGVSLLDERLAPLGCSLGSPRDPARRGAHISIRHPRARELTGLLIARGVVTDFREPDSIRFGMPPLTTSFGDVARGLLALEALLEETAD